MFMAFEEINGASIKTYDFRVNLKQRAFQVRVHRNRFLVGFQARQGQTQFIKHVKHLMKSIAGRGCQL